MADKKNPSRKRKETPSSASEEDTPLTKTFRSYQQELDERHDKYERIVKLSRDITVESKRAIFLLHRAAGATDPAEIFKQADEKLKQAEEIKFRTVAQELVGEDPYQFLRAYSPGLQEYIEALTFLHYLQHKTLLDLPSVTGRLSFPVEAKENQPQDDVGSVSPKLCVPVPPLEYFLGVADLTGELMRLAINSVGNGDLDTPVEVCQFLRELELAFTSLGNTSREIGRKIYTLRQSLRKVETACYTLQVRGSEIPKHMLVDVLAKDNNAPIIDDSMNEEG